MKFCLNSRQTAEYLQKADEIKVEYRDIDSIFDLIEKYNKTIILDCFNIKDINWKKVEQYNKLAKNNFIICVGSIEQMRVAHTLGIKRYLGFPISSFYELNCLEIFDPEYILLDTELFFRMSIVKRFGKKIRVIPNLAYNDNLPHGNGIFGTWIRPEDLESIYGEYIDAVEFADCDQSKEQALFRIYAEQKEWRQPLKLIVTNLDADGVNRLISSEVSEKRLNCEHKCQQKGSCRICERAFLLANVDAVKEYIDSPKTPI